MASNYEGVKEFHDKFGQKRPERIDLRTRKIQKLRIELIREEFKEFKDALKANDPVKVADALTDILYVTYGAFDVFGMNADACFAEVQRSNMSKLGADGKPVYREDGKILKGPNYSPPDLASVLGVKGK